MRLDKWLYYSRWYSTRNKSQNACIDGNVIVNKIKKNNFNFKVSKNDIITLIKNHKTHVFQIIMIPSKRISVKNKGEIYKVF